MKSIETAIYTEDSVFLKNFIRTLHYTLEKSGISPVIHTFQDGSVLESRLTGTFHYDVLFLDMDNFKTGLKLAECSNHLSCMPLLVLLSSSEKIPFQFLRLQPFRVLRKNTFQKEIGECVQSILHDAPDSVRMPYIILDCTNSLYRLNINHIRYIESLDKHLKLVMEHTSLTLRYSMNEIETLLQHYHFLRVHKSYLVNAHCIFRIDSAEIVMDDQTRLPLSRYRAASVKEQFREMFQWDIL